MINNKGAVQRRKLNNEKVKRSQTKAVLKNKTPFNPPLPEFKVVNIRDKYSISGLIAHITTKANIRKAKRIKEKNNDGRDM